MVTLLLCNILWWRKDDGWRFELERGVNFSWGIKSVFSFDPTWFVLAIGTSLHGPKVRL